MFTERKRHCSIEKRKKRKNPITSIEVSKLDVANFDDLNDLPSTEQKTNVFSEKDKKIMELEKELKKLILIRDESSDKLSFEEYTVIEKKIMQLEEELNPLNKYSVDNTNKKESINE